MAIEKTPIDLKPEHELCAGVLLSEKYIKNISIILSDFSLIKSPYIRQIVSWAIDYYKRYEKAPGHTIFDIFESKKQTGNPDIMNNIEMTLNTVADRYFDKSFNEDYYYNAGMKYLSTRRIENIVAKVNGHLASGNLQEAEKEILNYNKTEVIQHRGINVFKDKSIVEKMFQDKPPSLFTIPGAFGEMCGNLNKGDVFNLSGLTKIGKTWMLLYFAVQAYLSGLNVVYFSLEMDEELNIERTFRGILGQPVLPTDKPIEIPFFNEKGEIETRWATNKKGLTFKDVLRSQDYMDKQSMGSFQMYSVTDFGCKLSGMVDTLDIYEKEEGIVPEVVLIDYIDIAERESDMFGKSWEVDNLKWLYAKRNIAQKKNCLLITVSQVGREGVDNDSGLGDGAGAFSKTHHVSQWVNINQTDEEMKANILRAKITGRNVKRGVGEVVILQCLDIGRPVLDSRFLKEVANLDEYVENGGNHDMC